MIYQSRGKLFSGFLMCMLLSATVRVQAVGMESIADLLPQHRTAAQQWLVRRPWLRLATQSDCANKQGLEAARHEYGRDYQPYYAVGDFNRDGQEDFAVALVNQRKRSRRFAIAVFNGPFNRGGPGGPALFTEGIDLSDGGLVVRSGNQLIAGVFQTDNCILVRPRGRSYVVKDCS